MNEDAPREHPDPKRSGDFLRKKTDSGALPPAAEAGGQAPAHAPIPTDSAFAETAARTVAGLDAFGALAIGIDPAPEEETEEGNGSAPGIEDRTARVIDTCCRERHGVWGVLDAGLYGCILPGLSRSEADELSAALVDAVAEGGRGTVSVGAAVFPEADFPREQILDNALKALDHAAFFGPGAAAAFDAVSLNISGDKHYDQGDISGAIEELQRALTLDPEDYNVHNSLGVCYGILGAYEKALKIFEAAMALSPGDAMAVYNAGLAHMRMGDRDRALGLFLAADKTGAPPYEVGLQAGRIYLDMKKPAKARPFLERAVEDQPDAGIAHRYLGECLEALDRIEPAVAAYKKAIKCNPSDAEALSALGCLFDRMGENPEISAVFCRQSIDLAPENGLFRERFGALLLRHNRLEEALAEFFRAEELGRDVRDRIAETRERLTLEAS